MATEVELHVPEFETVKSFYGALGFRVVWEYPPDADGGYLVMQREDNVLRFWPGTDAVGRHSYFSRFPAATPRGFGVELVLNTSDLDETYMIAQRLGSVVRPLRLRPWGLRDFRVTDPFGYYLRFTEPHDILNLEYGGRA